MIEGFRQERGVDLHRFDLTRGIARDDDEGNAEVAEPTDERAYILALQIEINDCAVDLPLQIRCSACSIVAATPATRNPAPARASSISSATSGSSSTIKIDILFWPFKSRVAPRPPNNGL